MMIPDRNKFESPYMLYLDKTKAFILEILRFLGIRYKLIICCCIVSLGTSLVLCLRKSPVYTATAKIRVEPRKRTFDPNRLQVFSKVHKIYFYYTQYIFLHNYSLVKRVVQQLDLARKFSPFENYVLPEETAIAILSSSIGIGDSEDMELLAVSVSLKDRHLAAEVANKYVEVFKEYRRDIKRERIFDTLAELEIRISEASKKLDESEKKLQQIKKEKNLSVIEGINIDKLKLVKFNRDYLNAKVNRIMLDVEINKLEKLSPAGQANLMMVKKSFSNLYNLRDTFFNSEIELASLREHYGESHPDIAGIRSVRKRVKSKIDQEISGIIDGLKIEYEVLLEQEKHLENLLNLAKEEIKAIGDAEISYLRIKWDVDIDKGVYRRLRQEHIKQMSLLDMPEQLVTIVEYALAPSEDRYVSPNYLLSLSVSFLSMLGIGMFLVVLYGFLEKYIYNAVRERAFSVLSVVPNDIFTIDVEKRDSIKYESFKVMVSKLLLGEKRGIKSVFVTSGGAGEGKTTIATNLAIVLGDMGKRVLVVDANLRKPDMPHFFNIAVPKKGLKHIEDFMSNLKQLIVPFVYPSVDLLPAGEGKITDDRVLVHEDISRLLKEIDAGYDAIIFDGPPLIGFGDSLILADLTDGIIVVETHKKFTQSSGDLINESLRLTNGKLLGTVLNSVPTSDETYKYYYQLSS